MKTIRHPQEPAAPRYNPYDQHSLRVGPQFNQPELQVFSSPPSDKLAELERGQIKLTASQTLAEVILQNKLIFLHFIGSRLPFVYVSDGS